MGDSVSADSATTWIRKSTSTVLGNAPPHVRGTIPASPSALGYRLYKAALPCRRHGFEVKADALAALQKPDDLEKIVGARIAAWP
jgi:hypothetical protein